MAGPVGSQQIGSVAIDGGLSFLAVPLPLDALVGFVVAAVFQKAPQGPVSLFEMGDAALDEFGVLEVAACDAALEFDQVAHAGFEHASAHGVLLLHPALAAREHIDVVVVGAKFDLHFARRTLPVMLREVLFDGVKLRLRLRLVARMFATVRWRCADRASGRAADRLRRD